MFSSVGMRESGRAVDGADVVETELSNSVAGTTMPLACSSMRLASSNSGGAGLARFAHVLGGGVELAAHQLRQVAVERAHRGADGHVVVVQDDQQVAVGHARRC